MNDEWYFRKRILNRKRASQLKLAGKQVDTSNDGVETSNSTIKPAFDSELEAKSRLTAEVPTTKISSADAFKQVFEKYKSKMTEQKTAIQRNDGHQIEQSEPEMTVKKPRKRKGLEAASIRR